MKLLRQKQKIYTAIADHKDVIYHQINCEDCTLIYVVHTSNNSNQEYTITNIMRETQHINELSHFITPYKKKTEYTLENILIT